MRKIVIAFIPVLHEGYRSFFEKHKEADTLFILGPSWVKDFDYLKKEIRALEPKFIKKAVESWQIFKRVRILERDLLQTITALAPLIVMPDEDVTRGLAQRYFSNNRVLFDPVFLRWDKHNSVAEKPVEVDQEISLKRFDQGVIKLVRKEAQKSSDWWRRVGAAITRNRKIILVGYNEHVPSQHLPYVDGDPRNCFHKGIKIELSTSIHAEAKLISLAAKKGISLQGADMYVSTFPCPPCAKLIAYSGIKKLYYAGGYGVLDGERVLKSQKVKLIFVDSSSASQ